MLAKHKICEQRDHVLVFFLISKFYSQPCPSCKSIFIRVVMVTEKMVDVAQWC